ncbi:MAG TPA: amidase [Candidatus Polarisedimenticolia bacterium]|nr:amidase [Candidatus Polarisedimenticolia bacterium]
MTENSENELAFLPIERAARMLRRREISPVELVDAALARIERWNPALNAFLTVLAEPARRRARAAERALLRGRPKSPLHGIPISLKDNFWTRGVRTTAGSRILADFVPDQDSDVAVRLARAGAILLGKTNMHEFAYGITSENPHFGTPRNPWARERITGGSSGGSAAAVAAGMGFASVGTDTGGSIRIPAALCGIVGLKPTFGLVSVAGVVPLAPSFDHAGPLARSATDACIILEAIAGNYPRGAVRLDYRKLREKRPRRLRVGWPKEFFFDRLDVEVQRAVERGAKTVASSLGGRIEEVSLPRLAGAIDAASNLVVAEASYYHESQGYYPARAAEYGDDVRGHLEWGHELRAVDYLRGVAKRREVEEDFAAAFERVDVIVAPTSPIPAPPIGTTEVRVAGERETKVRAELLRLTRPANLTGQPAMSLPCGFTREGLPVGLQLIGPRWGEAKLLSVALAYEEATEWHDRHPQFA